MVAFGIQDREKSGMSSLWSALRTKKFKAGMVVSLLTLATLFSVAPIEAKTRKAVAEATNTTPDPALAATEGLTLSTATGIGAAPGIIAAAGGAVGLTPPSAGTGKQHTVSMTFKKMGAATPIQLRGVEGSQALAFSIRSDEVVVAAKLKLNYAYSPSLIAELSHLKIQLNEELVSVIPLPRDKGLNNPREIEIDPRLFTDYNNLSFRLIGHYTTRCEDPLHSSLWLTLSNLGSLELTLAPLGLENDLKFLPAPFFDKQDGTVLRLPFVFAGKPGNGTLKAAGIVSSWFGSLASYRGAQFPVLTGALPEGNAVVFLQGGDRLGALAAGTGPAVSIEAHPTSPGAKLLVVSGATDEDLMRAARAIVLSSRTLTGQRAAVIEASEPPLRKPYDAPTWVPTNRAVRFGELARSNELQVQGFFPDVIRINFRVSPDLFTWRSSGVPIELKYRFTRLPYTKNSTLNVNINRNFVHSLPLYEPARKMAATERLKLPVLDADLALREDVLFVPPYQVGGRNQLQLHYYFSIFKEGECMDTMPNNLQGAIDPESTLDFSAFPHYAAMPNLAFFSNIGFPFTRMADLSETAVVMPDGPNTDEISMYLTMMGRMGEATGYPVLRHAVINAPEVEKYADRDLIVIGSGQRQTLMTKWADALPLVQVGGERRVREPDVFRRAVYRWDEMDLQTAGRPDARMSFKGGSALVAIMAFESPLKSSRSVVYLHADKSEDLQKISAALNDPERVAAVQGDFVVVDDFLVEHAKVANTYYVGGLDPFTYLRWSFSKHPLVIGFLGLFISLLLAVIMYRLLRTIAAKRLQRKTAKQRK
jgi:hypothetical protein